MRKWHQVYQTWYTALQPNVWWGKRLQYDRYLLCCFPHKNNVIWNCIWNNCLFTKRKELTFLQQIITIDETWVGDFEPELKSQNKIWKIKKSPRLQKFQHQASTVKQMMIMVYAYTDVIATYTVPYDHTVDQHVYVYPRKISRPKVQQMCSQMLDLVITPHNNTGPHIAMLVTTVFQECGREVLDHPLYSPDLSTSDYNLFPKLKKLRWEISFSDLIELFSAVTRDSVTQQK